MLTVATPTHHNHAGGLSDANPPQSHSRRTTTRRKRRRRRRRRREFNHMIWILTSAEKKNPVCGNASRLELMSRRRGARRSTLLVSYKLPTS